jgi:aspartyl-tRNA(Asn)/glutamyl-tRNA(Gln) amidotransferase subunit A
MNNSTASAIHKSHNDFRSQRTNPLDETRSSLIRATEKDADHVFIKLTPKRALAAAESSSQRYALGNDLGLLDGISVVWKDLFDQAGELTTAGSKTRMERPAAKTNATCVDLLESAGCCSLGRTNLSEFAFSGLGVNPHFGTPSNAFFKDSERIPGGSSSGSAVAVALKIATIGIGTDTSGSVRVPAALNGIVGFRPTQTRYDRNGVFPLSSSLDTVGTFARSVADITIIDRVLSRFKPLGSFGRLDQTIFDLSGSLETEWDGAIYDQYQATLRTFESRGYKVEIRGLSSIQKTRRLFEEFGTLVAIEAKELHQMVLEGPKHGLIDPVVAKRLNEVPKVSSLVYKEYCRQRAVAIYCAKTEIGEAMVAFPTVPEAATLLSELIGSPSLAAEKNVRMLSNTMIASFLDLPGIALPTFSENCLVPGSILLSGAQGQDEALLRHAALSEQNRLRRAG